ncbi:MBL fold metallo-hydrolase [Pseudomonas sp. RIT-PI-AD]|uniref:MBL fold metallo-hydrolase n=1 Tax=Pseudomonas sp. RIT-PI-AD TaxID=3035294 RepID=UPI0021D850A4|nr:MBL fold metallo-hydrolase [Pseudomonas sp. RIT-PI-AD]
MTTTLSSPIAAIRVRRRFLVSALALASGVSLAFGPGAEAAPVAQQKTQVPGYYRLALGESQVTALYDGYTRLNAQLLKGASGEDIQRLLAKLFVDSQNGVQTAVNAFLINTGSRLLLVDTGAARCLGPSLGHIQANLKAAGYAAEQVDGVLLTHLHPDHACGLLDASGAAAFPNAEVYVSAEEATYWLSPESRTQAAPEKQKLFRMVADAVAPYEKAGRLKRFDAAGEVLAGIGVKPLPGHTPGHTGYLIGSGPEKLLLWGDVVHSHATQFAHPEISIEFDSDGAQAIESRKRILSEAAKERLWVAGAHLPFPGIGHVRSEGSGYAWVPAEYAPLEP